MVKSWLFDIRHWVDLLLLQIVLHHEFGILQNHVEVRMLLIEFVVLIEHLNLLLVLHSNLWLT